ncbi:MAG: TetR/AcrR family transcriptional regulator [Christensenellales bacterium]
MEKKQDLRIQKTHKALIKSLRELLCEKSFDEITVTELCDRAETRKATFYKHFGDKFELFIFMIKELQCAYDENNEKKYKSENVQAYYAGIFRYTLDFLERDKQMVLAVLSSTARWTLIDLVAQQVEFDLKIHFKEDAKRNGFNLANPELLAAAFTGALVQSACWWMLNKNRFSKEEIIEQFSNIVMRI